MLVNIRSAVKMRTFIMGKAFALDVAEAPQDPNIMTGTFSLNDHFTTVLFDSGADYSFISSTVLPLINMKPNVVNPGYEIEIASGLKVITNMIVRGMDWLSKFRAKIVCYEKIVQIPLSSEENLEVHEGKICAGKDKFKNITRITVQIEQLGHEYLKSTKARSKPGRKVKPQSKILVSNSDQNSTIDD
ncbi:putative reverse transcriptase domain-containing protein [Tanacetum coccineum]|uniref:Reverse transcriptase domain-containing protein n=1 Tax=Tanacetum coccineum TaxID=301880 RepID=A0ABQ4ZG50_9ASTR